MDETFKSINDFLLFILYTSKTHGTSNKYGRNRSWMKNSKVSNNFHLFILSTQEDA
jgi:hypothetical protein